MQSHRSIKIMHVASGDLWGGAEAQLFTLAKYLKRSSGIELLVVLMNDDELAERLKAEGVNIVVLDEKQLGALSIFKALRALIKRFEPDVIHTHRQKENVLTAFANAGSIRAKSVRTQHGAPEFSFTWRQWPQKVQRFLDYFSGRFLQQAVIAVSKELATKLELEGYPASHLRVIENGVDLEPLQIIEAAELKPSNAVHVGIVGRLVPVKRVDLFLEMAAILLKQQAGQAKPIHFHVLGDGPLRDDLEVQAVELGIQNNVSFHGHQANVAAYMKALDVLVMCSDHEGLPMTLLEAMALGVPVASHNAGAMRPIFECKVGGILSEAHNAISYAQATTSLLENNLQELIAKGQAKVKERYSAENNAQQIKELYSELLSL